MNPLEHNMLGISGIIFMIKNTTNIKTNLKYFDLKESSFKWIVKHDTFQILFFNCFFGLWKRCDPSTFSGQFEIFTNVDWMGFSHRISMRFVYFFREDTRLIATTNFNEWLNEFSLNASKSKPESFVSGTDSDYIQLS